MEKILTISIAAYNVEKYLEKLLDSIISADVLNETEVLVVNDGSKDSTVAIAKKYEEQYPNSIFLVNKENGGHGSTINKGIELAKGKYFKVIDGDDWVDSKGLKKVVEKLKQTDTDLVVCDYQEHYEASDVILDKSYPELVPEKRQQFHDVAANLNRVVFHAGIFRTAILKENNIRIDENSFYVDVEYMLYPIPYIHTIIYYPINVYCYRLENAGQSMSYTSLQKNIKQHENVSKHVIKFYKEKCKGCSEDVKKYLIRCIVLLYNKTYEIYFSFPCKKQYMLRLEAFDNYVKETSIEAYSAIPAKTIKFFRKNIRLLYPITWLWLRFKGKKYGRNN